MRFVREEARRMTRGRGGFLSAAILGIALALLPAVPAAGYHQAPAPAGDPKPPAGAAASFRTVTVEEIEKSLPASPVRVGFDVDDTVLFSSPAIHYALTNTDGPGGTNRYGARPLENPAFWSDLNSRLDKFSLPKKAARDLIRMHRRRGDTVFFITKRRSSPDEQLTRLLNRLFGLDNAHPVVFTNHRSKTEPMKRLGIVLYYTDSDGDVRDARRAGVRVIRFLRSPLSINTVPHHPGAFGEKVLRDSDL